MYVKLGERLGRMERQMLESLGDVGECNIGRLVAECASKETENEENSSYYDALDYQRFLFKDYWSTWFYKDAYLRIKSLMGKGWIERTARGCYKITRDGIQALMDRE